jgi:O-antigen ligase
MSMDHGPARAWIDPGLASGAALLAGCGVTLALAGAAAGRPSWVLVGGAGVATALAVLVSAEWLDGMLVVALAVPLPALVVGDGFRLAAAAPVAAVVLAGWAWGFALPGRRLAAGHVPRVATAVLVGAWIISTLLARAPLVSARELLNLAVLLALLVAAVDVFRHVPASREGVVTALALLAGLCGAGAVLETVGVLPAAFPLPGTSLNRAALGFGQPNGLGLFLAMSIPLLVHRLDTARGQARAVWLVALLLAAAGLVGTFSRGGVLAVLAGALTLVFVGRGRRVLAIWVGALAVALFADLATGGAVRDTVTRTVGDWVVEQRAALAVTGLLMYVAHPIVGVGPGGFAEALDEFGALVPGLWDVQPTPHNAYIQAAAETGTIGLAAFLLFMAVCGWTLLRSARRGDVDAHVHDDEAGLRRAVLWSMATVAAAGMVIWPFAHGYGEAVILILAVGLSARDPAAAPTTLPASGPP